MMHSFSSRAFGLLLCALSIGCVDNSILELEVNLPVKPSTLPDTEDVYAFIQIRSSRVSDFENDWLPTESIDGFLLTDAPSTQTISIVSEPQDYDSDLLLRVLYCSSSRCSELGDDMAGERRLRIEHPFYDGERTRVMWDVGEYTDIEVTEPEVIPLCQVQGCRPGDITDYCYMGTNDHFCSR